MMIIMIPQHRNMDAVMYIKVLWYNNRPSFVYSIYLYEKAKSTEKRLHVQLFCIEPYALHPSSFTATHITVVLSSNVILCIHKVGNIFSREYKSMAAAAYSNRIMAHTCLDAHITGTTTTIHYGGSSVESMNGYSMNAVYNITTIFVYLSPYINKRMIYS